MRLTFNWTRTVGRPSEWRGACIAAVALAAVTLSSCSEPTSGTHVANHASPPLGASKVAEPQNASSLKSMRLITQEQYLNTVTYIFGADVRPAVHFPPPQRTNGLLALGSSMSGVTDAQVELYQKSALAIATIVVNPKHRRVLIPCAPLSEKAADPKCAAQFLTRAGRLLTRRSLTPEETAGFVGQANEAADRLKDFYAGLAVALEALLVSPEVLFVAEAVEPDSAVPGHQRLDAYSLASRLSFFLWNAAPDEQLLRAAETGALNTADGRNRTVDMMLASPRLIDGMRAFFDDMLGFDDFANLAKDPKIYPSFTGITVQDAREQALRTIVDHLIAKGGDYRDLFTTRTTFLSPALGAIYGVPVPPGWTKYEFPADSHRAGLLTQVSYLASHAHPGRSSPTLRGKALRELLLCQPVPRPPANVDFSIIEDPNSTFHTARQRLDAHRQNPVCAGCHKITDPIGLALENFDGAGQYRATERGVEIDASGSLDGREFHDAEGLGQALHDSPSLTSCLVKRLVNYATGSALSSEQGPVLEYFDAQFGAGEYRLPGLLRAIVSSRTFDLIRDDSAAPQTGTKTAENFSPPVAGR